MEEVKKSIVDILDICKEKVFENQTLANKSQVKLEFSQAINLDKKATEATFTAITDKNLLSSLLQNLLEISIHISSQKEKETEISLYCIRAGDFIEVVINFDFYISEPKKQQELFTSPEGVDADRIAARLNIPLKVIPKPETKQTSFVIYIHI
ncbi:hypothetical protein A3B45_01700 [Candidatus Daviesbacteria bacterium RIFCSPLOWO2_01_FULL_39_12]|uniref:Uncharacterized protein n=1 Tax=Candidatus Daviesbacteria bacterium RIFCSPLOWO2_01_FULL_39_12 TaxID=1797785 RepID=A0A1F5KUF3_9BACT|nr:MAG: hypothetical protein A3D79_03210 [Candidatus Daviesbacteria bacterium RIFCSPHIGHO2_02_FULL_39_8]OGE44251.1 MAG: hypothetical protein A3B45_01700 [Candidatus Daviesbacteria bacterium RIFCSPLOWO2_01_FULL_39_12]HLC97047.1 hypothetical protein [Candidatus Nanoarchaeia archaeon]